MDLKTSQKKYVLLLEKIKRLRGWQREWERHYCRSDKEVKKKLEREIDRFVEQELKKLKSAQMELL